MDKVEPIPKPPGWGDDKLSEFLQRVQNNQFATFVRLKHAFDILEEIDGHFVRVADNLLNPRKNILSILLLYRSHAAYRAACGTSMAGQSPETFVLLRSCLEYSGYALLIHKDTNLGLIWLDRHTDEASLKKMRREFQAANVEKAIQATDAGLARVYDDLYNRSIDFGGHLILAP